MTLEVCVRPEAERDLAEAAIWYEIHGPNGYTRFYLSDDGHIHGPNGYTQCYVSSGHIHGPKEVLPWIRS